MTSTKPLVLRVCRSDLKHSDGSNAFVLVHVKPSSSNTLNMQLYATEGERAFATRLKQAKLPDLRHKSYSGSPKELEKIFSALLLKQPVADEKLLAGVEITSSVGDDTLTLAIRKDVGGIKQRIAAIQVPESEVDIHIFEWAGDVCAALESTNEKIQGLESRVSAQKTEIEKLASQLKTFAELKKEHEELLLVKFKELLNAKKAKIRELNRVLQKASSEAVNKEPVSVPSPPKEFTSSTRSRQKSKPTTTPKSLPALAHNTRKRKPIAPPSDSDSDGGFVAMDLDFASNANRKEADSVDLKGDFADPSASTTDSEEESPPLQQLSDHRSTGNEDGDELPPPRKPFAFAASTVNSSTTGSAKLVERSNEESEGRNPAGSGRGKGRVKTTATARDRVAYRGRTGRQKAPSPPPAKEEEGMESMDGGGEDTPEETDDEL